MHHAIDESQNDTNIKLVSQFIREWGLDNAVSPKDLELIISKHRLEKKEDMDKQNEVTNILNMTKKDYKGIASDEIAKLSWIKYRKQDREDLYNLADEIKRYE